MVVHHLLVVHWWMLLTRLSLRTRVTVLDKIHSICFRKILNDNFKLGGQGKTVGIDESMFGNKRQYNCGPVSEVQWVFGMVEWDTGRSLVFHLPDHQRETLVTILVREFVEPVTVIISDKFSPHLNLNNVGYSHLMVNHLENFIDPYTGAHSNTIEDLWRRWMEQKKQSSQVTLMNLHGVNSTKRQTWETDFSTCCPTQQRSFRVLDELMCLNSERKRRLTTHKRVYFYW